MLTIAEVLSIFEKIFARIFMDAKFACPFIIKLWVTLEMGGAAWLLPQRGRRTRAEESY
jgi:hypothetical protein